MHYTHPLLYSSAMQCCPFDNNIHQCPPLLYYTAQSSSPTPLPISFHSSIRPSSSFSILYCFNSDASTIGLRSAVGDPRIDLILSLLASETGDEVLLVECQGPNSIHISLGSVIEGYLGIVRNVTGMCDGVIQSTTGGDVNLLATWHSSIHGEGARAAACKDGCVAI